MEKALNGIKLNLAEKLKPRRYFIKTYGCQMNVADSEDVAGMLEALGFEETPSYERTDLFIVNTCSVRQAAEDKVYGLAPKINKLKGVNPQAKAIIIGCMVGSVRGQRKRYPEAVLQKKVPWADYLLETKDMRSLPQILLKDDFVGEWPIKAFGSYEPKREDKKHAFVNISTGCDNFCTFCVVPFARGKEKSRSFEEIVQEVEKLSLRGYEHVTLVGQNVNSWGDEKLPFAALLRRIHEVEGVKKISFISSNPFDFTMGLVKTLSLPKIDRYLHMAVQSGDNKILKKMNRRHTVEDFKKLIKNIRKTVPEIKIGTDIIVGFPGEAKEQFQNTVDLCRQIRFANVYIAMYSERPGTLAAKLYKDDVPKRIKRERHAYLTKVVEEVIDEPD